MSNDWAYRTKTGQVFGPITSQHLRELARAGNISPADFVRRGGDGEWVVAQKVKGLFDANPSAEVVGANDPLPSSPPISQPITTITPRIAYKVLTQKDKWLSQKFDPETLERAINSYAIQGWRVCAGDTASFPGFLTGFREELIVILKRAESSAMPETYEYKVLTQKDKWYSGKFDPERLEGALNAYAQQGWAVVFSTSASFPGFFSTNREELIVIMERRKVS